MLFISRKLINAISLIYLVIYITDCYNNFNELKQDMENKVNTIALAIEDIFQHKCEKDTFQCPVKSFNICEGTAERQCLNNFPTSTSCSGTSRYSRVSGIRIPNSYASFNLSDQTKYFLCKTAQPQFQNVFQGLLDSNQKNYAWLNFGSSQGSHRVSPGFKYQKQKMSQSCKNYDPRLRPWYAANAYNRKKMIIIVENSKGIHQLPNRYPSIQLSVQALLKTAQPGDYFNIIQFSDTARAHFSDQKNPKLVSLQQQIQKFNANTNSQGQFYESLSRNITKSQSSESDYFQALQLAMNILVNSKFQNRQYQNMILMFSAFRPSNMSMNRQTGVNSLQQFVQKKSAENRLNVSFFGFGVNMLDERTKNILRNMSCALDGIFFDISDIKYETMFLNQAKGFYQFLSVGNQVQGQRWTNFYQDAFGLGRMTTVVRAAYYNQSGIMRLIGLAGIDVLVSQLTVYKNEQEIKRELEVTQRPFKKYITQCQLEILRRNQRCNMTPQQLKCPNYTFCQPKLFCNSSLQNKTSQKVATNSSALVKVSSSLNQPTQLSQEAKLELISQVFQIHTQNQTSASNLLVSASASDYAVLNTSVIKCALDTSDNSCCAVQKGSSSGLIIGLIIGIIGSVIVLGLVLYFVIIKKMGKDGGIKTYGQIYKDFKDFDPSRIRPESDISMIKE